MIVMGLMAMPMRVRILVMGLMHVSSFVDQWKNTDTYACLAMNRHIDQLIKLMVGGPGVMRS